MSVLYVLAHFDDEYCALPLVREGVRAGVRQRFLYVADYRSAAMAERRLAETRALLARLGVDPADILHVGRGAGAQDGAVFRAMEPAYAAVRAAAQEAPVERILTLAWEGGHMDHDACACLAAALAAELGGAPVETFSLYNGPGLPGPMFRGGAPLVENGPIRKTPIGAGGLIAWMAAVRFYPSQAKTWLGLWPAMFWTYVRRGFGVQRLDPARLRERPHPGPLFYERMFGVPYAEVRAAADAFLGSRLPLHDHEEAGEHQGVA